VGLVSGETVGELLERLLLGDGGCLNGQQEEKGSQHGSSRLAVVMNVESAMMAPLSTFVRGCCRACSSTSTSMEGNPDSNEAGVSTEGWNVLTGSGAMGEAGVVVFLFFVAWNVLMAFAIVVPCLVTLMNGRLVCHPACICPHWVVGCYVPFQLAGLLGWSTTVCIPYR